MNPNSNIRERLDEQEDVFESQMLTIVKDEMAYYIYGIYSHFLDEDVAYNIPTREAAEQIAAIYKKAMEASAAERRLPPVDIPTVTETVTKT
jgi:hypothetical protein